MRMMNVITRERRDETRVEQQRRLSQRWGEDTNSLGR